MSVRPCLLRRFIIINRVLNIPHRVLTTNALHPLHLFLSCVFEMFSASLHVLFANKKIILKSRTSYHEHVTNFAYESLKNIDKIHEQFRIYENNGFCYDFIKNCEPEIHELMNCNSRTLEHLFPRELPVANGRLLSHRSDSGQLLFGDRSCVIVPRRRVVVLQCVSACRRADTHFV